MMHKPKPNVTVKQHIWVPIVVFAVIVASFVGLRACTLSRPSFSTLHAGLSGLSFQEAFKATGTDKYGTHGYHRFYDEFLNHMKGKPARLLEIGAFNGQSLTSWRQLFHTNSSIYAIAYGSHTAQSIPEQNIIVYDADQSNCADLVRVKNDIGAQLDLIIDDGSHVPEHVIRTLGQLFPLVKPGGYYIIEDIETSYWDKAGSVVYGYKLPNAGVGRVGSAVEILKLLVEVVNQRFAVKAYDKNYYVMSPDIDPFVSYIAFAQNMVVIKKASDEDKRYQVPAAIQSASGDAWAEYWSLPRVDALTKQAKQWMCP